MRFEHAGQFIVSCQPGKFFGNRCLLRHIAHDQAEAKRPFHLVARSGAPTRKGYFGGNGTPTLGAGGKGQRHATMTIGNILKRLHQQGCIFLVGRDGRDRLFGHLLRRKAEDGLGGMVPVTDIVCRIRDDDAIAGGVHQR